MTYGALHFMSNQTQSESIAQQLDLCRKLGLELAYSARNTYVAARDAYEKAHRELRWMQKASQAPK